MLNGGRRQLGWLSGLLIVLLSMLSLETANSLRSANYEIDELTVGSGGFIQSSSANFQSRSAAGSLGIGRAASESFQIEAGPETSKDPTLAFSIDQADSKFTPFSATTAATTVSKFSVINYTSYGYVVQVIGKPPSNGEHTISPMTETATSQPGSEQFGINLVANTEPMSLGANPNNGEFGHGLAAPNYDEPNKYRFVSGETVAMANKSSGKTSYTISYLVNVEPLTPGGQYTSDQTIVVTGTY